MFADRFQDRVFEGREPITTGLQLLRKRIERLHRAGVTEALRRYRIPTSDFEFNLPTLRIEVGKVYDRILRCIQECRRQNQIAKTKAFLMGRIAKVPHQNERFEIVVFFGRHPDRSLGWFRVGNDLVTRT